MSCHFIGVSPLQKSKVPNVFSFSILLPIRHSKDFLPTDHRFTYSLYAKYASSFCLSCVDITQGFFTKTFLCLRFCSDKYSCSATRIFASTWHSDNFLIPLGFVLPFSFCSAPSLPMVPFLSFLLCGGFLSLTQGRRFGSSDENSGIFQGIWIFGKLISHSLLVSPFGLAELFSSEFAPPPYSPNYVKQKPALCLTGGWPPPRRDRLFSSFRWEHIMICTI